MALWLFLLKFNAICNLGTEFIKLGPFKRVLKEDGKTLEDLAGSFGRNQENLDILESARKAEAGRQAEATEGQQEELLRYCLTSDDFTEGLANVLNN